MSAQGGGEYSKENCYNGDSHQNVAERSRDVLYLKTTFY